jgi:hypothetical protein
MDRLKALLFLTPVVILLSLPAFSQTDTPAGLVGDAKPAIESPASPPSVTASDTKNDDGSAIDVSWQLSPDDQRLVTKYQVLRSKSASGPFEVAGETTKGQHAYTDNGVKVGESYFYKIAAVNEVKSADSTSATGIGESQVYGPIKPIAQWFNMRRLNVMFWLLVTCAAILFYIWQAKSGKELYVRKIAGIDAVDDAIGRATEMGRKVFFVPGIQDMDDVATIAAITILGRVARICATNETMLDVPVSRSLVMVTARESVREAYSKVGRPDAFKEDQVHYVTDDQFGYAAAIDGMVMRDKPAAMFYMGGFFAEALILAETGNNAGAIQIAGTNQPAQIPFFVAACDYTLIGEELFAASAYLEREPRLLGSLKGQDFAKGLFLLAILILLILAMFGVNWVSIMDVS